MKLTKRVYVCGVLCSHIKLAKRDGRVFTRVRNPKFSQKEIWYCLDASEIRDNKNEQRLQDMNDWVDPIGKFSLIMNWTELIIN